jgi:hypothetical protein
MFLMTVVRNMAFVLPGLTPLRPDIRPTTRALGLGAQIL